MQEILLDLVILRIIGSLYSALAYCRLSHLYTMALHKSIAHISLVQCLV